MEFTRLADVDVVETANYTDKVLIEQNGEIKRVPKTEVGGSGGNTLVLTHAGINDPTITDPIFNANMTLTETIEAFNKQELTGVVAYMPLETYNSMPSMTHMDITNATQLFGSNCIVLTHLMMELNLFWTDAGISAEPPMQ